MKQPLFQILWVIAALPLAALPGLTAVTSDRPRSVLEGVKALEKPGAVRGRHPGTPRSAREESGVRAICRPVQQAAVILTAASPSWPCRRLCCQFMSLPASNLIA